MYYLARGIEVEESVQQLLGNYSTMDILYYRHMRTGTMNFF